MSRQAQTTYPIPEETQRVARAAFPKGNLYMRMRDELGEIYIDEEFAELFPGRGQPAESPGRLAWVTVLQFAKGLSDRQAAEAVRGRMDWKYVLGLELSDAGFDYSVLSEFRERLVSGGKEEMLLEQLLTRLKQRSLLKAGGSQRTDATHILAAVRQLNRLEIVGETMRRALNELAEKVPEWVKMMAKPEWFRRYGRRFEQMRLPKGKAERDALLETIGKDGVHLLETVRGSATAEQLRHLEGVEFLRRMWLQQYWVEIKEDGSEHLHLRKDNNQPPGVQRLHSPYDDEVRFSAKRGMEWVGYKTHLSETSDPEGVQLITQVTTTFATEADMEALDAIHTNLAQKNLLPHEHQLDAGYVDAETLVVAKQVLGVTIISPVREKMSWQAKPHKALTWQTSALIGRSGWSPVQRGKLRRNGATGTWKDANRRSKCVFRPKYVKPVPCKPSVRRPRVARARSLSYLKHNISHYNKPERSRTARNSGYSTHNEPGLKEPSRKR
jgi:transposase